MSFVKFFSALDRVIEFRKLIFVNRKIENHDDTVNTVRDKFRISHEDLQRRYQNLVIEHCG